MKHFIFTISFRFLIVAYLSLITTLAHANTCNLGLGGEGEGGVGGTGIVSQGVGGTGISSGGNDEVATQEQGIGGTGARVTESGIGGTGAKVVEGGIGGTGAKVAESGIGGTGIVGVITGFASICVNGVEAHYDNSTQIDINGVPASIENLNIGQLVAIDAIGKGAEVKAQRVSVIHTLVGRVDEVIASKNQIKVMKQVVQLGNNEGGNNFKPGQSVAISGLFTDNGVLRATRADVVADSTPSSVTGALNKGKVLSVPVTLSANNANLTNVQVSGRWDGKTLKVSEVKTAPTEQVMRAGQAFDLQGTVGKSKELQILGKPIVIGKDVKVLGDKTLKNAVIIVRGQINSEGRAVTRELEYRSFEKILERGGSKERPAIDLRVGKEKNNDVTDVDLDSKDANFNKETEKNHTKHMDIKSVKNPDKIERSDRQNRTEKLNLLDKPEKVEKVEKPEKPEKPEKVEKIEKPEKVEKIEKPEKVEKVEKVEREEHVERVEHVERD